MQSIVMKLTKEPKTAITLTQGCDELCGMCPNNRRGVCTSPEKVTYMDNTVLSICGLSYGENVLWRDCADKARNQI